jgi:hypothetical protein
MRSRRDVVSGIVISHHFSSFSVLAREEADGHQCEAGKSIIISHHFAGRRRKSRVAY